MKSHLKELNQRLRLRLTGRPRAATHAETQNCRHPHLTPLPVHRVQEALPREPSLHFACVPKARSRIPHICRANGGVPPLPRHKEPPHHVTGGRGNAAICLTGPTQSQANWPRGVPSALPKEREGIRRSRSGGMRFSWPKESAFQISQLLIMIKRQRTFQNTGMKNVISS